MFTPIEIELPFPDRKLSPNAASRNWRTKEHARKEARDFSEWIAIDYRQPSSDELQAKITFFPPNKKRRDLDNLLAAMKPTIDGVCKGVGVDDWQIKRITIQWGDVDKDGKVIILLESLQVS